MPSHNDYVQLLHELVCSVDAYVDVDPDWSHISTSPATDARTRMYEAARRIMFLMSEQTLTDDDIDAIFWTE